MTLSRSCWLVLSGLTLLTVLRVAALYASDLNLGGDEAQYWFWSTELAWGYYSKPPMIAALIALGTGLFGDSDAAVRLASPLLHGATAWMLYLSSRRIFDETTAVWTALIYISLPAVSFSSYLITTDVPLLFFWSVAFYGLLRFREAQSWPWALLVGLALGAGLLSKYAAAYFVLGLALYALFAKQERHLIVNRKMLAGFLLAFLCLLPNILWNMDNQWATVGHTQDNINWGVADLHWGNATAFIAAQFGVFGPILFAALIWRFACWRKDPLHSPEPLLLSLSLPILALIVIQAFVSRAHANWAATAYLAATPLVVAWLLRRNPLLIRLSLAINLVAYLLLVLLSVGVITTQSFGLKKDILAQLRGWDQLGVRISEHLSKGTYSAVMANDRMLLGELLRYLPKPHPPVVAWTPKPTPGNHYQLSRPLRPELAERVLYLSRIAEPSFVTDKFERASPAGRITLDLGGAETRSYYLYALEGWIR